VPDKAKEHDDAAPDDDPQNAGHADREMISNLLRPIMVGDLAFPLQIPALGKGFGFFSVFMPSLVYGRRFDRRYR
jgi:hypothetical protein